MMWFAHLIWSEIWIHFSPSLLLCSISIEYILFRPSKRKNDQRYHWHRMLIEFLLGGTAACCAGLLTNPLEVIKTRVQLQGELKYRGQYTVHYRNVFHAFYVVAKNEGICSLQKGLVPALYYQFFMNGVRLGVFQAIDNKGLTRNSKGEIIFPRVLLAGAVSGGCGALVGSPFYLVRDMICQWILSTHVLPLPVGQDTTTSTIFSHCCRSPAQCFRSLWCDKQSPQKSRHTGLMAWSNRVNRPVHRRLICPAAHFL